MPRRNSLGIGSTVNSNTYTQAGSGACLASRRDVLRLGLGSAAFLAWGATPGFAKTRPRDIPYYGVFRELPVGAVKPDGWIASWLRRQADGLTGHPENLAYPYDTCMYTGKIPPPPVPHGEIWWGYEQSAYLIDGAVRLSYLIDAPRPRMIAGANVAAVTHDFGPGKLGNSIWGWPNTVIGRALMAQHSATGDALALNALSNSLSSGVKFVGRDGYVIEQALYVYGQTGDKTLLDLAKQGYEHYFQTDATSFSNQTKLRDPLPLTEHGVTAAEQLKLLPLYYCHSGDAQALELAHIAYEKVTRDSLMPDGGMASSSEALGAPAFNSTHETCDLTDWSWSMGYMLMASGEARWGDAIEKTIFNALPGAVTKDFRQLQYFSSANQLLASNTASPRVSPDWIAPARMSYRAAHDTECCSGNVNRAMPNYVTRMWMGTTDGGNEGLAAVLYGPCEVTAQLNGHKVTVTQSTDYPFRDTISFTVKTRGLANFTLALRIPQWSAGARLSVNGTDTGTVCTPGTFVRLRRDFRNGDTVELKLPMRVQLKGWFAGQAVSIERGPLVYSLKVGERRVVSSQDSQYIRSLLKGNDIAGFPAVEFYPAGEWRYGIEAAVKNDASAFKVIEAPMSDNPFLRDTVPVRIEVSVRSLPQWQVAWRPSSDQVITDWETAPKNPQTLPKADEMQAGETQVMTFVPYGATHLRLTTLPVIASERQDQAGQASTRIS
jgi:hypothetical protein